MSKGNVLYNDDGTVNGTIEGTNVLSTGEAGGTKFLREDGDGTCSWQAPAGGGGLTGTSIKTIGTGGDYADVSAFLAANSSPYHGVLVSNVTEDSDIAVDGKFTLDLDRYVLTMGAFQFVYGGVDADVSIIGSGIGSGAEIDWTYTSAKRLFACFSVNSYMYFSGLEFDNNSTATSCYLFDNGNMRMSNCKFYIPNINQGGVLATSASDLAYIDNCEFVGGGTLVEQAIILDAGSQISNTVFSGTFKPAALNDEVLHIRTGAQANNIMFDVDSDIAVNITNDGQINGLSSDQGRGIYVNMKGAAGHLSNADLGAQSLNLSASDSDYCRISNVYSTGALIFGDIDASNNQFINCRFSTALTLSSDRNKFTNCDFIGGASVSSGADNNGFVNCQFGADAGAGALTLTIASGSNNTRVVGCMTDAAISDSGTKSTLSANIVY